MSCNGSISVPLGQEMPRRPSSLLLTVAVLLLDHASSLSSRVAESVVFAQRGRQLAAQGLHAEAVAALEQSVELDAEPSSACATLLDLGLVWEEASLPLKALESYGRALELDPSSAPAYMKFGAALENHLNERDAAIEAVSIAVQLDETCGDAWNLLGQLLHSNGDLDDAQNALAQAVELQPADVIIRRNFATTLRATGRFDESFEELRAAISMEAEDVPMTGSDDHPSIAFAPASVLADSDAEGLSGSSGLTEGAAGGCVVAAIKPTALPESTPAEWREPLRFVHATRVATDDECDWAIAAAEAHAKSLGGWDGAGHHDTHKTNDIVVADCAELSSWVRGLLRRSIWPAIEAQYGISPRDLWLEDCFVVKYEASGQPGLGRHADDSELSFNLLLSDPASFDGGGTAFADADPEERTVCPARGEVLTHFGRVMHEGKPTTGGAPRYILAGFVRARPLAEEWKLLRSTNENASPDGGGPE